ncbi:hypothetical protein ACIBSW_35635 [Actinoplanes sp. NPDC049668]|uniref:hypothetical protein n=1 Tax=Actinoplanes sp. NPDC049668 TaxID=3363904 RepID=UPI003791EA40
MGISPNGRRPGAAVLAAVALGLLFGPVACGDGENRPNPPSARPSAQEPTERPTPTRTERTRTTEPEEPTGEATAQETEEPTRPTRTATPDRTTAEATTEPAEPTKTQTTTRAPATTEPTTEPTTEAPTTEAPEPTPASAAPVTSTASDTSDLGPVFWFLMILLAAGVVGALVVWRSRRKQDWQVAAEALAADSRAVVGVRLPAILTTTTAADRALAWPPVRAELAELAARWGQHAAAAPGEEQRQRAGQVGVLLQDLISGVDAENEALATGREWQLLRPRVDDIVRTLSAALGGQPQPGYGPQSGPGYGGPQGGPGYGYDDGRGGPGGPGPV